MAGKLEKFAMSAETENLAGESPGSKKSVDSRHSIEFGNRA